MLKITEPSTMLTDYLIFAVSVYFGLKLFRQARRIKNKPRELFGIGFFVAGAAALVGGTFHGFALYFDAHTKASLWNTTLFLIGTAGGFMVSGALVATRRSIMASIHWLISGIVITLAGFGIQQSGIVFAENFNHNDLFHLTQIIAFYCLYRLAKNFEQNVI
jgi:hypothetical protein